MNDGIPTIINNKLFENIRFEVKDINVELMSKGQDVDLLKNIANYQNGKYYDISNYTNLLNELKENTNNKTKSKQEKNNLLEQWWFLFIIPIFLAIEWFLRKRNGLY
jgi:ATP-dependent Zn protease